MEAEGICKAVERSEGMTKHYCDRCGAECKEGELKDIRLPVSKTRYHSLETKRLDVCPTCEKEFNGIIDTLLDIHLLMFDKLYKKEEGAADERN